MALTFTPSAVWPNDVWGSLEVRWLNAVPAVSDYTTGGYVLTPGVGISLGVIYFVIPTGGQGGIVPVFNPVTGKLQMYEAGAGSISGATITSTSTAPTITTTTNAGTTNSVNINGGALTSITGGTGITGVQAPTITSTLTGGTAAAGPLAEVSNGGDLSAFIFTLLIAGR